LKKIAETSEKSERIRGHDAAGRSIRGITAIARLPDTIEFAGTIASCQQLDDDRRRCARRDDARMDRQILGNESRDAPILPEFRVEEGRSPRAESREWNVLGSALMIV
jgi:hypothetical protein